MTYDIRQLYESDLYVGREQDLEVVQEWWRESKKRLLSVTAPPANGKTWFLKKVEETLRDQEIVSFWMDAGKLLLSSEESIAKTRKPNPELINDWLQELVDEINLRCPGQLEEFIFTKSFAENIEKLVVEIDKLCQLKSNICIFIDDGDRFDVEGWREFERWLLEPFAEIKPLRFVIAVREKRSVQTFPLRMSEIRIKLTPLPGDQQIEQLLKEKFLANSLNIRNFLTILQERGYVPIHPGLNNFICLYAVTNPQVISNIDTTNNIFSDALEAVNYLSKEDIEYLTTLLHGLSRLDDEWDIEDLVATFQVSRSVGWDYIQVLEDYALITRPTLNRYKIVEGIRGFARAILQEESILLNKPRTEDEFILPHNFHYKMDEKFNVEELEEICFNLHIDDQDVLLKGRKLNKIITLIKYCGRHDRLPELLAECQRLRFKADWMG